MERKEVAMEVSHTMTTEGWRILMNEAEEKLDLLDYMAATEKSAEIAASCMQQRQGILFLINRAKDLVKELS